MIFQRVLKILERGNNIDTFLQSYSNQTSRIPSNQTCTSTTREHRNPSVAGCFLTIAPQIHVKERAVSLKWMLWKMNIHLQYWSLTLITHLVQKFINTNQPHTQRSETLLLKGMTGRETFQDIDRETRIKGNIRQMDDIKLKGFTVKKSLNNIKR